MNYGISFILGILIAAIALLPQVGIMIVTDVFLYDPQQLSYTTPILSHALPAIILAACIEECVRVLLIAKMFLRASLMPTAALWHGVSLGGGFWATELMLRLMGTMPTSPLSTIPPLLIHITVSSIAVIMLTQRHTLSAAQSIVITLLSTILLHATGNALIFLLHHTA